MNHIVVEQDTSSYHLEEQTLICDHVNVVTEKACCHQKGDSGYIECACAGLDFSYCENPDCSGFDADDLNEINNDCWG